MQWRAAIAGEFAHELRDLEQRHALSRELRPEVVAQL
jgi:hypothetical protein